MYICICRGITDTEFKENLQNHEGSLIGTDEASLKAFHAEVSGCGTQCGSCLDQLDEDIITPHNNIAKQVQKISQESTPEKTNTPVEPV